MFVLRLTVDFTNAEAKRLLPNGRPLIPQSSPPGANHPIICPTQPWYITMATEISVIGGKFNNRDGTMLVNTRIQAEIVNKGSKWRLPVRF